MLSNLWTDGRTKERCVSPCLSDGMINIYICIYMIVVQARRYHVDEWDLAMLKRDERITGQVNKQQAL